ncbi:MAG: DUF3089 domain-containing protein [Acidimicrobiales bacterium]|jgi:hypothetical protein|nr:DUF3089 domain-containing protein [Acidimicrobiales bacterium]
MRRSLLAWSVAFALSSASTGAACSEDPGGAPDAGDAATAPGTVGTGPTESTPQPAESAEPAAYAGYTSQTYGDEAAWLCRPAMTDSPCLTELDLSVVAPDGTVRVEPFEPAEDPPIDCFYVYPTVSQDPGGNADRSPGPEETGVANVQAGRFSGVCDVYAPVYRQVTVGVILGGATGVPDRELAYGDVLDAWKHYIVEDNDGRGVVLIGHSQGSSHLTRLIREEIDPNPELRDLLVSALLLGSAVRVPAGQDVGGDFAEVPACRAADQVGCVVSYASFRSTAPPPPDSLFGRPREGDGTALCVNPANPTGGATDLQAELPVRAEGQGFADPTAAPALDTGFVALPGLLRGECVARNGFSYLEVTVQADRTDPRADDIAGDLTPPWGLHLVDVSLALGDLVELVAGQAEAYTTS